MSINQPPQPKKKWNWKAPKTTPSELETLLSNVERSLLSGTSRQAIYEHLPKGERKSLKNWRVTQLFPPCGDLIL